MRTLIILFASLSFAMGEGFLNLPGETNSISIQPGEVVILASVRGDMRRDWPSYKIGDYTFNLRWGKGSVFAGPCELSVTAKCVVAFARFPAPYIHTLIVTNATVRSNIIPGVFIPPPRIDVPAGKTLRILPFYDGSIYARRPGATNDVPLIRAPASEQEEIEQTDPVDLPGPLDVRFEGQPSRGPLSFYFVEDAPPISLTVEKSSNLEDWSPVMIQSVGVTDPRAFYRLKISR